MNCRIIDTTDSANFNTAREGAVGIISAAQMGFKEPDFAKNPLAANLRAIKNRLVEVGKRFSPKQCYQCLKSCNPSGIPYCITDALIKAANGDVEEGLLFCGANAYKQEKIEIVKEVIENLSQECV